MREAYLFEETSGDALKAYICLKNQGGNIPPMWIDRSRKTRKNKEKNIAKILKKGHISDVLIVEDWNTAYKKECFYQGIRILFELERHGKTKL